MLFEQGQKVAAVLISICSLLLQIISNYFSPIWQPLTPHGGGGGRSGLLSPGSVCMFVCVWLLSDTHFLIDSVSSAGLAFKTSALSGVQHFPTRHWQQLPIIKYVPVTGKDNYVLCV